MTKDLNCYVTFYQNCYVLQDLGSGKVRMIDKEEDGLYTFYSQHGQYNHNKVLQQPQHCMTTIQSVEANANIWHQRLGHVPMGVIRKISSFHKFGNKFTLHKCYICPLARQTRLHFHTVLVVLLVFFSFYIWMFGVPIELKHMMV